ncbi:6-bladed beta-propeller [Bacteroides sp.]|uniref:6-bladed beta-propeller n=1 Tax=Bacteroides sp. TaxID=29523 RepID=UPI00261845E9|nr:6-bladed beta-propeller [Bacteroides sp.]MDD3038454.1 6-bladed beta-propeller [Bacteroides sp.]
MSNIHKTTHQIWTEGIKTLLPFITIIILLVGCSGKKTTPVSTTTKTESSQVETEQPWYDGEKPFIFDEKENYPETKIKLSDLAEVSYIPLKMNDSTILKVKSSWRGNDFFVTSDRIYLQEIHRELYIFKKDGTFLNKINREGEGPEDYINIGNYIVDTLYKEIFIQDWVRRRTQVYDLEGNFKRTFLNFAFEIVELNDSLLLNFFQHFQSTPNGSEYSVTQGPQYSVTRKKDGSTVFDLPIHFNVKLPDEAFSMLAYGSLIKTPQGVFLSNLQNDTIFEIKRDLSISPRIIDISDYGTTFAQAHPTIETKRYLMFNILRSYRYKPEIKQRFYIYDKKEKQIYKMTDFSDKIYWALLDNYPQIQNWDTTQSPYIAVRPRQVRDLFMAGDEHGDDKLKEIIKHLNEKDNPVLQVMTFHDVEQVLK